MRLSTLPRIERCLRRFVADERGGLGRDMLAILLATALTVVSLTAVADAIYRLYLALFGG